MKKNIHMLKSTYKTVRSDIMRTCMNTCDIIPADTIMCSAGMILIYNPTLRMNGRMDGWRKGGMGVIILHVLYNASG